MTHPEDGQEICSETLVDLSIYQSIKCHVPVAIIFTFTTVRNNSLQRNSMYSSPSPAKLHHNEQRSAQFRICGLLSLIVAACQLWNILITVMIVNVMWHKVRIMSFLCHIPWRFSALSTGRSISMFIAEMRTGEYVCYCVVVLPVVDFKYVWLQNIFLWPLMLFV